MNFRVIFLISAVLALSAACSVKPSASSSSASNNLSGGSSSSETAVESNSVFVSALGSDTNSGLKKATPLFSIQAAIDLAKASNFTAVYISGDFMLTNPTNSAGVYFAGVTNVDVSGGWNSSFTSRSGESVLRTTNSVASDVVCLKSCIGVVLRGLALTGGYSGIYIDSSSSNIINCAISNNGRTKGGGGIYMYHSGWNLIGGSICGNSAAYGGGIYDSCSFSNFISAAIYSNDANGGGGVYLSTCTNESYTGLISGNMATNGTAGGVYIYGNTFSNTVSGMIIGNSAANGGGLYLHGKNDIISAVVTNNTAQYNGGGIFVSGCVSNTILPASLICFNRCNTASTNSHGGGIYFEATNDTFMIGTVVTNNYNGSTGSIQDNIY